MCIERGRIPKRRIITAVTVAALVYLVSGVYLKAYSSGSGFVSLIQFGSNRFSQAIPEVRSLPVFISHPLKSKSGYDGQFYAQLSVDPTLNNPNFDKALDNRVFRSRRIFIPALAHILGFGDPGLVIQVYAVINLFFWIGLVALLLKALPDHSYRSLLCMIAISLNTGVMDSMRNALTDLPGAVLLLAAVLTQSYRGAGILSLAALTRENSILGLPGLLEFKKEPGSLRKNIVLICIVVIPFLLWVFYTFHRFPKSSLVNSCAPKGCFYVPFIQIANAITESYSHIVTKWSGLWAHEGMWKFLSDIDVRRMFSICLRLTAIGYLFICRKPDSRIWRFGIVYAFVAFFMNWYEGGDRLFLPMIIGFYVLLASEKSRLFFPLFLLAGLNLPYTINWLIKSFIF